MELSVVSTTLVILAIVTAAPDNSSSDEASRGRSYGNRYQTSGQQLISSSSYLTPTPQGFSKGNNVPSSTIYNVGYETNNIIGYSAKDTNNNNGYQASGASNNDVYEAPGNSNNAFVSTGTNYNNAFDTMGSSNNVYVSTGGKYNNGQVKIASSNNDYVNTNGNYNNGPETMASSNNAYVSTSENYNGHDLMRTKNAYGSGTNYNKAFGYKDANYNRVADVTQYSGNAGYMTSVEVQPSLQTMLSQERFHPHTSFKGEEDSHTGEVVLPPVSFQGGSSSQDLLAAGSQLDVHDSFLQATDADPVNVPAASPVQNPPEIQPPQLPYGYNYQLPPSTAPTPYYYYPPPTKPPSSQYLPAPATPSPPYQYLPAPKPSGQYLPTPQPPQPPPPPPPDQERQADYTYYYLGPKLWYIPLFFSIYFVLYVGALIIKAISKHKILFPQQLYNAASSVNQARQGLRPLDLVTARVTRALAAAARNYLRSRTNSRTKSR